MDIFNLFSLQKLFFEKLIILKHEDVKLIETT